MDIVALETDGSYKPEQRNAYWEPHERTLRGAGIDGGRLIMEPRPEDVVL